MPGPINENGAPMNGTRPQYQPPMKQCPRCGQQMTANMNFCPRCGLNFATRPMSRRKGVPVWVWIVGGILAFFAIIGSAAYLVYDTVTEEYEDFLEKYEGNDLLSENSDDEYAYIVEEEPAWELETDSVYISEPDDGTAGYPTGSINPIVEDLTLAGYFTDGKTRWPVEIKYTSASGEISNIKYHNIKYGAKLDMELSYSDDRRMVFKSKNAKAPLTIDLREGNDRTLRGTATDGQNVLDVRLEYK